MMDWFAECRVFKLVLHGKKRLVSGAAGKLGELMLFTERDCFTMQIRP
jgi:hypothetical protein